MSKRRLALFRLVPALAMALLLLAGLPCFSQNGARHALVFGNNEYSGITSLRNPVND
jgi:hypothetical protein